MKLSCLVALFSVLLPLSALAEPVLVKSGEHPAFTRLVVPVNGTDWSASRNDSTFTLTYDDFEEGFEISKVFDLIPRSRIEAVEATPNQLILTLACECAVSVVTERGLYVVIDIANSPDALNALAIVPATLPEPKSRVTSIEPESGAPKPLNIPTAVKPPITFTEEVEQSASPQTIAQLQQRLSAELDTAARRGMLTPAPNNFALTPARRTSIDTSTFYKDTQDVVEPDEQGNENAAENKERTLANLRISSSRDLPNTFRDLTEITASEGQVCPPDDTLNVASWGDVRPFAIQVSEARQGLYGEFDRIDPSVAIRLAKIYIFFGFGAEAHDILDLDPEVAAAAPYLVDLSRIVDGEPLAPRNTLSGLAECGGETSLWAILASPMPAVAALPDSDNAIRSFNTLPAHLRAALAPDLNKILMAYGDRSGAAKTLRSLERLAGKLPPAVALANAQTALNNGKAEQGRKDLKEIVDENTLQSPEALINLVDAKVKADEPISSETAQLVEAYVQELKGTDQSVDMKRAFVIALVQSDQFDRAYATLATLDATEATTAELKVYLLRALTKSADDITFLDHVFSQSDRDIASLASDDLLYLAERFLTLGFPAHAERTLGKMPSGSAAPVQKLLMARTSLALEKPFKAQADLLGLRTEEANRLRADAKRMAGNHDEAHALYSQINRTQDAIEVAWLSDDWRNLTSLDAPVFGPASALPLQQDTVSAASGMLARTTALLDQSAKSRETLQDLLAAEGLQILEPEN